MNVKQFEYVLTLAREGSFSKAAEVLNISQPSLSQYVKKIEREVGFELFDRANGEVRVTDAGRVYIDTGRKILELERSMEAELSDIAEYKSGSLIIGAAPYRAAAMLPRIAKEFQRRYPGMHLVVKEGTTSELSEGMEHGEFDFALTLSPVDKKKFDYDEIAEEELTLAVPRSYPKFPSEVMADRRYPAVDVTVMDGQKAVMLTDAQFMQKQLENLCTDYKITVRTAAVVKSLLAQISMVKEGIGIALVPAEIKGFVSDDEVVFYSLKQSLAKRKVVLMRRKGQKLSEAAREFREIVQKTAVYN